MRAVRVAQFDFIYNGGGKMLYGSLSQPTGNPYGYDLTIGGYYWGSLVYQDQQWRFYGNQRSEIYGDDLMVLVEMVEEMGG